MAGPLWLGHTIADCCEASTHVCVVSCSCTVPQGSRTACLPFWSTLPTLMPPCQTSSWRGALPLMSTVSGEDKDGGIKTTICSAFLILCVGEQILHIVASTEHFDLRPLLLQACGRRVEAGTLRPLPPFWRGGIAGSAAGCPRPEGRPACHLQVRTSEGAGGSCLVKKRGAARGMVTQVEKQSI
jgi:hypothetical protein